MISAGERERINALFDPVSKEIERIRLEMATARDDLLTPDELVAVLDVTPDG